MDIIELISQGRTIEKGLTYVCPPSGVIRTFSVYRLTDQDEYYRWKEIAFRFLQMYYSSDLERFMGYSEEFEKNHYAPRYISNMVGVLEACKAFPSEKVKSMKCSQQRYEEINKVLKLEREYIAQDEANSGKEVCYAFHAWHAAACVLFDKWFYVTDEDWIKFQGIEGNGNSSCLGHDYDKIYSSYRKLIARLQDGRGLKGAPYEKNLDKHSLNTKSLKKVNIFISYAHTDTKWLEKLQQHLKVLTQIHDSVEYWEDTKLRGGDRWQKEITKAIEKANVAILLVSTAFLASDFITSNELPPILKKAKEEGTTILPLIVSPCDFEESELSEFQAVNSPDKTLADLAHDDAAIERIYLEVTKCIKNLLSTDRK